MALSISSYFNNDVHKKSTAMKQQQQQHHANILSTTFQSQSQRIRFSVKKRISHLKKKCRCHELAVARLGNSEMDQELLPFSIWY